LKEDNIFVTHGLLRRALGENDARPSLSKHILEHVELIESTFALEFTLEIGSLDSVDDVTIEV